jgi:hypothetical protein
MMQSVTAEIIAAAVRRDTEKYNRKVFIVIAGDNEL